MAVSVFRLSVRPVESAFSTFYHYVCTIVSAVVVLFKVTLPNFRPAAVEMWFIHLPDHCLGLARSAFLWRANLESTKETCNAASSTLGAAFGSKRQSFDVGTFFCEGVDTLAAGQTSSIPL